MTQASTPFRPRRPWPALTIAAAMVTTTIAPPLHAGSGAGEEISHQRIGTMLERVGEASYDVFGNFPEAWHCKATSPEWLASLDPKVRRAFGDGHIRVEAGPEGWKLTAEDVRRNALGFNLALAALQLKIAADLATLQVYLPAATAALVATVVATPLTHEPALFRDDDVRRVVLEARDKKHALQEITFDIGPESDLRGARVVNSDGGELDLAIRSDRPPWADGRWLASEFRASHHRADGTVEVFELQWEFAPVTNRPDTVLPKRLSIARLDGSGKPIRGRPQVLNPMSLELWGCRAR